MRTDDVRNYLYRDGKLTEEFLQYAIKREETRSFLDSDERSELLMIYSQLLDEVQNGTVYTE